LIFAQSTNIKYQKSNFKYRTSENWANFVGNHLVAMTYTDIPYKNSLIFFTIILLLAFGLRIFRLDNHGIFFDEKSSLMVSQGAALGAANQPEILNNPTFTPQDFWKTKTLQDYFEANTRSDIGNSPAYYVLLHGWIKAFGLSDFSVRFFSVLWSLAIVILLFFFVKEHLKSNLLALISSFLMSIEPFFITYAQQARNYSMTFFFTLLATHIFLKIVKNEESKIIKYDLYFIYGIVSMICLLSHFLSAVVFMVHGIYVLLFVRMLRPWILLPIALSIGLIGFGLWITHGGGQYTFHTLGYQAKMYAEIAKTAPTELISPASFKNVLFKTLPIITDLFWVSNGLTEHLSGFKNFALALISAISIILLYSKYEKAKNDNWIFGIISIFVLGGLFFSKAKTHYFELVFCVILFVILIKYYLSVTYENKKLLVFFGILTLFPAFFLVIIAFKNGHTFGLTQRYSGFAFPYAIILLSISFRELLYFSTKFQYYFAIQILIQFVVVGKITWQFYEDISPKYSQRVIPRKENPYSLVAQTIIKNYQKGDTLIYPSFSEEEYGKFDIYTASIQKHTEDAQLINLYLPPNANYIQKINLQEPNKVILKKTNGKELVLCNFEGKKNRY
jgi:uncharacterized membrane protein